VASIDLACTRRCDVFEGFERLSVETTGAVINLVRAGNGPPLLLLHGYPQTLAMWHLVAPRLAEHFTVVAADLRGYGASSKPEGGADHAGYSKRAMAQDQVEMMQRLGFEEFFLVGHDRGGRVGHRMALDHPQRVKKLAVLDIVPTRTMFAQVNQYLATVYYHWFRSGADHAGYSKRAMAQDQVEMMQRLGFEEFFLVGHDRGGRVGHRMALDHPQRVKKLAVLDIVPTRTMFAQVNQYLATVYYHWFFL